MDLGRPFSAVVPTLEGDVLVVLAGTTRPLSGARVAQLVRRGKERGVSKALDRLVDQGLVHREHAGAAYLHTLNRDHVAAPAVRLLAGLRGDFLQRLRDEIAGWDAPPMHASMFGSAARGDGDIDSDVDLLVIRASGVDEEGEAWRTQVARLAERVEAWTGNRASIVELAEGDLGDLASAEPPVIASIRADGIDLAGASIPSLFEEAR